MIIKLSGTHDYIMKHKNIFYHWNNHDLFWSETIYPVIIDFDNKLITMNYSARFLSYYMRYYNEIKTQVYVEYDIDKQTGAFLTQSKWYYFTELSDNDYIKLMMAI